MVVGFAIDEVDESARHASNRPAKAVIDSHLQSADIEIVEITIQGGIAIPLAQVIVVLLPEPLAEEVANMTKDDEDEVAYVGGKEEVVRRLVRDWIREGLAMESAGVLVGGRSEGTELGMCLVQAASFRG